MHGVTMKFIEARQTKLCNTYKNTRLKLLRANAALWFNKVCRLKHLKPNYIHFKTSETLCASVGKKRFQHCLMHGVTMKFILRVVAYEMGFLAF